MKMYTSIALFLRCGIRTVGTGIVAAMLVYSAALTAQVPNLTAQQQQMLNSLPPAQRQQAMRALDDLRRNTTDRQARSINEPLPENAEEDFVPLDPEGFDFADVTAQPHSVVILQFTEDAESDTFGEVVEDDSSVAAGLPGSHVFTLDDEGRIAIGGLQPIALAGLSEADIARRLEAEPLVAGLRVEARVLPQEPTGAGALAPFGYDVFEQQMAGMSSPSSGPVPVNYVLGPGDTVNVQLFGNINADYELEISRDGVLSIPEIGPVAVAGLTFSEFRSDMSERVDQKLIGTQVSVTMGPLRTIRVFVLGDVNNPGSYVVEGLTTISGALYKSGGVRTIGSLRNVQLKRNGRIVSRLDVYDLLVGGNTSADKRLLPGDVVFVPPIGKTVAVSGAIKRPAIYEVGDDVSVVDLIALAGGLNPEADRAAVTLERIDDSGQRSMLSIDLRNESTRQARVRNGDLVTVPEILPDVANSVTLLGHVHRPGSYHWRQGMRISDLLGSLTELKDNADTEYVLVRRQISNGAKIDVLSTSVSSALRGDRQSDIPLQARDTVYVFDRRFSRDPIVGPLLEELKQQAKPGDPTSQVEVSGNVHAPGIYPLESGMRISDLIRAGGGLTEEAYTSRAELSRYAVTDRLQREVSTDEVNLDRILSGDRDSDLELEAHDYLYVHMVPQWKSQWTVSLDGEVRFPGDYRVQRGESLAQVVSRAGGLTGDAFPEGAVFLREDLKNREQEQIELLARRLEADLTTLSLQLGSEGGPDTLLTGRELLEQLRTTEATGRLVIDRYQIVTDASFEVRDGDRLLIPRRSQVVTVIGETQQNTSHLFREDLSRDDYINLSGGLTRRADKKLIYVVRANGAVVANRRSYWFGRGNRVNIRPGDTIVVPIDTDRMRPMTFWTNVTQILYQGAIAVSAIRSFD